MASKTIAAGLHTSAYTVSTNAYILTNLGTVGVTSPIAIEFLGRGDTFINSGAVTGASYAVLFAPEIQNRLVIDPGATFSGIVSGGNTLGAKTVTTLELASAAATGTLSGLNSKYIDFGQVTIDAGATWRLIGGSTIANHQSVTNAGTLAGFAGAAGNVAGAAGTAGSFGLVLASGGAGSSSGLIAGGAGGAGAQGTTALPGGNGGFGGVGGAGAAGVMATGALFSNSGTIAGGAGGLGGTGGFNADGYLLGGAGGTGGAGGAGISFVSQMTLTNSGGQIIGGAAGQGGTGGHNSGTGGNGGTGGAGIDGVSGAVDNFAVIRGGNGGAAGLAGYVGHVGYPGYGSPGIRLTGGGTVVNETGGLIAGGAVPGPAYADSVQFGTGTSRVIIHPGATFIGNVDGGNTVGTGISVLEMAPGTSAGTLGARSGTSYLHFPQVTVDAGAQWTIVASGNLNGVTLADNGTLTNAATLVNSSGTATYGVNLGAGATLVNKGPITSVAYNAVVEKGSGATIVNYSQLIGGTAASSGVVLGASGVLTNQTGGDISGHYGVRGGPGVSIVNNSRIHSNFNGYNRVIYVAGGTITNNAGGQIYGTTPAEAVASSLPLTLANAGRIAGGGLGVYLGGGGIVTNFDGATISGAIGIASHNLATTVINYGTISTGSVSGKAVSLRGGFDNRVVLHPGFSFQGAVYGGDPSSGTQLSTLELAANTVPALGTISGLGSNYRFFSQLHVDAGARWRISGTNTVGYTFTLSVGGTLTNAGSLIVQSGSYGLNGGTPGAAGSTGGVGRTPGTVAAGGVFANQDSGGLSVLGGTGGAGGAGAAGASSDGDIGGAGGAGGNGTAAFTVASGGSIINYGTVFGGSGGAGGAGGATGTLSAFKGGPGGTGGAGGGAFYLAGGTLTNVRAISGGLGGEGGNSGLNSLQSGGAGGAAGGAIVGTGGVVVNSGLITGGAGGSGGSGAGKGAAGANGVAISFTSGGTVVNSGTIAGGGGADAIDFGVGPSRLILEAGANVFGIADGGNVYSGQISTLELARTGPGTVSAVGTLSGLGTQFRNFASVQVDLGASWMLMSGNSLSTLQTLTDHGEMLVSGQTVAGTGAVTIAGSPGAAAIETVTANGVWTGPSALVVGGDGDGELVVSNQGTAGAATVLLASVSGGSGTIAVIGTSSLFSVSGSLFVGDAGSGAMNIHASGSVTAGQLIIGNGAGANGSGVSVSDAGSRLTVGGALDVGVSASGALSLTGGATVTAGSLNAGGSAVAVGLLSVTDPGTSLAITGDATVADDGSGVLSVLNGAAFSAASLTIGARSDSSGAVVVSGSGSVINLSGALNVGTVLGTGDLTVGPGAAVHASVVNLQGQVVLEGGLLDPTVQVINQGQTAGGFGTLAADDIIDEGLIQAGGPKATQRLLLVHGTIVGGGTLTKNGTVLLSSAAGLIQINAGGTAELTGPVLNAASTSFLDALTPTNTYTVTNSVVDVAFADAAGVLLLDDIAGFAGTITSFKAGDQFVITGGSLANVGVNNGNTLTFSDSGVNARVGGVDEIVFGSAVSAGQFNIVNGNTMQAVACFAEGTRIETEDGPVTVEDLAVGDRVVTADGRIEPVVWIGSRTVNCRRHPRPEAVWPVRVLAGAFCANIPESDLYLSPDHAILVNDVLVPVKLLANGSSIAQVKRDRVMYYHVELRRHEVILAEGLAVESYLDAGVRGNFEQDGETIRLFPDLEARLAPEIARVWETRGAAPLVTTGDDLAVARAVVVARASHRNIRSIRNVSISH